MKALFEYKNYKIYLLDKLKELGRGSQKSLADAIGCQAGYIVQILKKDSHLSLEQAEEVNYFLKHTKVEADYFFNLVQLTRSGTSKLNKRFQNNLKEIEKNAKKLKNRLKKIKVIQSEKMQEYYSSWVYMAVHASFSLVDQTPTKISKKLGIPVDRINSIIDFLVENNLLVIEKNQYLLGEYSFHLDGDDPLILSHHSNWRLRSLLSMNSLDPNQLHYSSLISISKENRETIRHKIIAHINEIKMLIKENRGSEVLVSFNTDFFDL